jgi:hypothetical protein
MGAPRTPLCPVCSWLHANFPILFHFCLLSHTSSVCAGLIDLAIKNNSLIGGDDFKSGQTKMKSVLVDFLVGAGIKVPMTNEIYRFSLIKMSTSL